MKRTKLLLKRGFLLSLFMLMICITVKAQNPAPKAQVMISNDTLLDARNYQFDVYVRAKDTTVGTTSFTNINLKGFQAGFQDSIKNIKGTTTGFPSVSIVPNSSNFGTNPDQRPSVVLIKASTTNPLYVQLNPAALQTSGMIIYDSATDPLGNSGWVRACTIKLTDTIDFLSAPMHVFFSKSATYPTVVMANYTNPIPSNGAILFDTLRSKWTNPIINKALNLYTVSNTGTTVTLSGSESGGGIISSGYVGGVVYYLYKDAGSTPYATALGTGSAISWTGLPAGAYTVKAHRIATYMYSNMTGTATVVSILSYNVTGGGSYCQGGIAQTVGLDNSQTGVNYQLLQGGNPYGSLVAGTTGSTLSWTNLPAGIYTVQAQQGANTLMMNGSAIVTMTLAPAIPTVSVQDNCGSSTLTITNPATGATFAWTGGLTGNPATTTSAGTYSVTQTANGCTSASGSGTASPVTPPPAPTGLACYQTANFNNSTCQWVVTGTQPAQPTGLACYQTANFNNSTCQWDVTGTQPAQPTGLACYQTSTWNAGTCQWDVTGTQPVQPTGLACYQTATWNAGTCEWVVTGTQPVQPTGLACYQTSTWNAGTCQWDVTGTQPAQPTGLACYQTVNWNAGTCAWVVTGTQPAQPTGLACYQTATWNAGTCQWDVTGTPPAVPTVTAVANCGSTTITASNYTGTLLWSTGATTPSITVFDGNVYSVTQTINGCTSAAGSGSATPLTTNTQTVSISASATAVTTPASVTFTASTTGTVVATDIKWYVNNVNTGSTGTTYTYAPSNGDAVKAVINAVACNSGAISNTIPMTVYVPNLWTGSVSSSWGNAANWSLNVVPATNHDVVIVAGTPNMPTLAAAAYCHNLDIQSGATMIDNSNYLTIGGSVVVERALTSGKWHFISSPVLTATGYAFSYTNPDNVAAGATLYLQKYNEGWNSGTSPWVDIVVGNAEAMTPGKGYEVWTTAPVTVKLAGANLNSTNGSLPLTYSSTAFSPGWNLVGNPFSAALNVAGVNGSNATWSQTHMNTGIWLWDPSTGNYKTWNGSAGSLTGGIIPAYQSFMVWTSGANPTMSVPVSAKVHGNSFYKSNVSELLTLKVEGNNYADEAFINFNNKSTDNYDAAYDVEKIMGDNAAPQFYSKLSDRDLSINVLPAIKANEVVQMGFNAVAGTYSITASGLNTFATGTKILLEDTRDNTFTDLNKQTVYTFTSDASDNANRFKVHFVASNTGNGNGINVYTNNNILYVNNFGNGQVKEIVVYDLLGKEVLRKQAGNNTVTTISMQYVTAYYMVKVVTTEGVYTQKVYVK